MDAELICCDGVVKRTDLPEVLLNLSKISATVHITIPMLEFLSTLISLPKVFASFSTEQFLSVFTITLPYTNPFKFNHCRLTQRRDFVKFIVKGLGSNVLKRFEEGNLKKEVKSVQSERGQQQQGSEHESDQRHDQPAGAAHDGCPQQARHTPQLGAGREAGAAHLPPGAD